MSISGASTSGDPRSRDGIDRQAGDSASYIRLIDDLVPTISVEHSPTEALESLGYSGWRIVRANDHALVLFGAQSHSDLIGEPVERLISMADARAVRAMINSSFGGRTEGHAQIDVRALSSDTIPVRIATCGTGAGEVHLMFATIEKSQGTVKRLRASEGRYRQLFNQMPIALMRIDAFGTLSIFEKPRREGVTDLSRYLDANPYELERALDLVRIAEANDYAESLFGTGEPRSMLRSVRAYWDARPDTFQRMLCARYAGRKSIVEKTVVCGLAGQRVPVFLSQAFPTKSQPQGNSLLGMIDISAQVEAEAEVQRMRNALADSNSVSVTSELAASIAHEVSQPLSSIVLNGGTALRWLDRTPPDLERTARRLKSVIEHAERAINVVNGLRDMASGVAADHVPLDLNDIVMGALALVSEEAKAKAVELRVDLHNPMPPIAGIPVQITQVIVNLVTNAIQAIDQADPDKRSIHVQTFLTQTGDIEMRISDTGPGIEVGMHAQIFDSFYTTKRAGVGIGLAICRSIVLAHGGEISADHASTGGAALTVRIPAYVGEIEG